MILIVSMARTEQYPSNGCAWQQKVRFEELTGRPALIRHYTQVDPEFVRRYGFRAIFITGTGYPWEEIKPADTYGINDVLHQMELPVLAACGGHQLLGWCFNHDVRKLKAFKDLPIRKLRPGEPDLVHEYHPGYYMESGMQPVEIIEQDPIFRGLKNPFMVREAHYCEVKKLPPGFVHLARNENCELQAMRHQDKPLYGTQFHAETWTREYLDGRKLIANFFRIAGPVK